MRAIICFLLFLLPCPEILASLVFLGQGQTPKRPVVFSGAPGYQGQQTASDFQEEVRTVSLPTSRAQDLHAIADPRTLKVRSEVHSNEAEEIHNNLKAAGKSFDAASHYGQSEAEKAIQQNIAEAMASETKVGKPDVKLSVRTARDLACQPDLQQCPKTWERRDLLCVATDKYSGECASDVAYFEMTPEQKLAFARVCRVDFQCQGDCVQDFRLACPSLWREVGDNLCEAPDNYVGRCRRLLTTGGMSDMDKHAFGLKCGARWPCVAPASRAYSEICPDGWVLQSGQTCSAPASYNGSCQRSSHMGGMSVMEKKRLEVACKVRWPDADVTCARNYAAACPYGWLAHQEHGQTLCRAPQQYALCDRVQSFGDMTPDEKQSWETLCQQRFPCKARSACKQDWAAPCPADWYVARGGETCIAPASYTGTCAPVLHGLQLLATEEKRKISRDCGLSWPCRGEAGSLVVESQSGNDAAIPRQSTGAFSINGAVDVATGAVASIG